MVRFSKSLVNKDTVAYLQFLGAAGTVTGSKHLINTRDDASHKPGLQVLIDCGLFQGAKQWRLRNWEDTPVAAHDIDAVVLTHAHLDHCGWIPRLVKEGFKGPIYATLPTIDLCSVILPDSGHLQEEEARFHNKRQSSKHHPALPLYTLQEAEDCMHLFSPVAFGETKRLSPELAFRFVHAGHILGSGMVELFVGNEGNARKFLFTGDIGRVPLQPNAPGRVVHAGPEGNEDPEILVMESTYGNRAHPHDDVRPRLAQIVSETVQRGGSVIVPAFAVERTQKFLFLLKELMEANQIPRVPVFVDSPMANKAVEIFMKYGDEFNEEAKQLVRKYGSPLNWAGFHFAPKQEDSRKINEIRYPCNQLLFMGFQAPGTRCEIIKSGAKSVRIFSEAVPIRAQVAALEQFSDHADTEELLGWLRTFKAPPKKTFLVHGEPEAANRLQQAIASELGWNVNIAHWLEKVPLG